MRRWFGWIPALGDRVNPIVVKEFRQAVRSHLVVAVLMVFLLVDLLILGGYMLQSVGGANPEGGRGAFQAFMTVLLLTCLGFVPLYAGIRLSIERNDVNLDLLYVTTIPPGAIVRGKYLTAMALTLLIFSACMPFVVLTYLLRGIDLPTIFLVLALGFLCCAYANAMGVFFGCLPGSWFIRGFLAVVVLPMVLYMAGVALVGPLIFVRYASPVGTGGWSPWTFLGIRVLMVLLGIGLLHVMSVALISPKASNRMLVPRLYVTGAWAVSGIVSALWCSYAKIGEMMAVWTVGSGVLFSGLAILALGERDTWNRRGRRTIPRSPLLRVPAFLFYTGSAGGLAWCTLMFAATMLLGLAWSGPGSTAWLTRGDLAESCTYMTLFYGYILCYCLTTAFLRTVALRNVPTTVLPVIALLLLAALSLVPYLFAVLVVDRPTWQSDETVWLLASPLILSEWGRSKIEGVVTVFLLVWTVLALLGSAAWIGAQWRRFTPYRIPAGYAGDGRQGDAAAGKGGEGP